ncbi:MAG: hypothetical protein HFH89_09945 [Lachnospiraceae bacterium]|nr:hypothetical protein [uncultured Acetatifactor sp.]MCI8287957.1 hypothetical protein [Lachnospiraceae bacterium]
MKKLYALLMAGVMTVAMAVPVLAAPSREASAPAVSESYTSDAKGATDLGSTIGLGAANTSAKTIENKAVAEEVVNVTSNAQVLRDLGVSTNAKLKAMVDVSYTGTIPAGGVQIPFDVSGIAKKGDLVYILHRKDSVDGKPWEVVGQAVLGDNLYVTGTFTSFSPVAFMVVDSAQAPAATGVKAPKTGEF